MLTEYYQVCLAFQVMVCLPMHLLEVGYLNYVVLVTWAPLTFKQKQCTYDDINIFHGNFLAIFLNIDSTHVIWFGETWIKFLAFTSCAKYIVLNKQLKTCYEENERNVNILLLNPFHPSLINWWHYFTSQHTVHWLLLDWAFNRCGNCKHLLQHSIEIKIIIILDINP